MEGQTPGYFTRIAKYSRASRIFYGRFLRPGDFLLQNCATQRNAARMLNCRITQHPQRCATLRKRAQKLCLELEIRCRLCSRFAFACTRERKRRMSYEDFCRSPFLLLCVELFRRGWTVEKLSTGPAVRGDRASCEPQSGFERRIKLDIRCKMIYQ
jgi:hypothetical protein